MRGALGLGAAALAGLAGAVASLDGDADLVPFFFGLTFLGGVEAWAAHPPFAGRRRLLARVVTSVWVVAAIWIGVLLAWYQLSGGGDIPGPIAPEQTYFGLTATTYHLLGVYGGAVLMVLCAFSPEGWFVSQRGGGGEA